MLTVCGSNGGSESDAILLPGGECRGYQEDRFAGLDEGARRLVHRNGARRAAVCVERVAPPCRRKRGVRAWCTHRAAHSSARADSYRQLKTGSVPREGGSTGEIQTGDVVFLGRTKSVGTAAVPDVAMTPIAIQEQLNGKAVDGFEKGADVQYGG